MTEPGRPKPYLITEARPIQPGLGNPLLFQLLNEMDGVAGDCEVAFVLTTNRPGPAAPGQPGTGTPFPDCYPRTYR